MKQLFLILAVVFVYSCSNDSFETELNPTSLFNSQDDHFVIDGADWNYSLNFIPDTHWFKGEIHDNEGTVYVKGLQFTEKHLN